MLSDGKKTVICFKQVLNYLLTKIIHYSYYRTKSNGPISKMHLKTFTAKTMEDQQNQFD